MLRANAKHANKEKLCEAVLYEEKERVCMQNLTPLKKKIGRVGLRKYAKSF